MTDTDNLYDASRAAYAAGDTETATRLWDEAQALRLGPPMTDEDYRQAARELRATYSPELEAAQRRDDDHCEE